MSRNDEEIKGDDASSKDEEDEIEDVSSTEKYECESIAKVELCMKSASKKLNLESPNLKTKHILLG